MRLLYGRLRVHPHAELFSAQGVSFVAELDLLEGGGGVAVDGFAGLARGHPAHVHLADLDAPTDLVLAEQVIPGEHRD